MQPEAIEDSSIPIDNVKIHIGVKAYLGNLNASEYAFCGYFPYSTDRWEAHILVNDIESLKTLRDPQNNICQTCLRLAAARYIIEYQKKLKHK